MDINYSYEGVPTIRDFSRSDAFIRGLMGPFGSGKSSGCVIEIVRRAQAASPGSDGIRRSQWAVVRNTYPMLRDTTVPVFMRWLPPHYFGNYSEVNHEYHVKGIKGVDLLIKFRALDRPDHVSNLLSIWLTAAWVNEAREVPWAIIAALQGRVGRYTPNDGSSSSWDGVIMDTNPPDTDSWWYKLFEEREIPGGSEDGGELPDFSLFRQPGGMSPFAENKNNLKEGYYDRLSRTMDANSKRVYVDGEYGFVLDGKLVYPEYRDELHCKDLKYFPGGDIYVGWDFGLTPACVMAQVKGGRINVIDELCAKDMGVDSFSDQFLSYAGRNYSSSRFIHVGDPSGGQRAQTDEKTCFEI
ncbi:MAG: hypothetical protein L0Y56_06650, partial [Nitrospira sp.]|nr:hypothetical protein [Nitrospira sp.]